VDKDLEVRKAEVIARAIDQVLVAANVHPATAIISIELVCAMLLMEYGMPIEDFARRVEETRKAVLADRLEKEARRG
jgi:hypothetical protein